MSTLDFPLLPHSEQLQPGVFFISGSCLKKKYSIWKGTQNSSFAAKKSQSTLVFVNKAEFMLFTGQVMLLAISPERRQNSFLQWDTSLFLVQL